MCNIVLKSNNMSSLSSRQLIILRVMIEMRKAVVPKISVKLQYLLLGLNIELVISRTILKLQKWFYTFFNRELFGKF